MATTSHYLVAAGLADTIFLIVSLTTSRNDYFISLACRKGSCGNKLRDIYSLVQSFENWLRIWKEAR
jgi:hypothetical protein